MKGTFCVSLFILLLLSTFTKQQAIIGSCKDAGFSTCCTTSSSCAGSADTCFCDVQCHTFRDCCNDIDETCPTSFLCPGEEDRKIRLGSNGGNDTRLELCRGNLWGSLCVNDSWDDEDATVACRELGYTTGQAFVTDFGNVPVHNVRAECNDSAVESPLANCLEFDDGLGSTSCTTHAGLICGVCNDGDIRLRDGYVGGNDKDGRVEICLNNTWGSLCSDSWDFEDASVACRQLGYSSENALPANFWPTFGTVHSQDVLVHCTGNETSLRECIGDGDGSGASSFLPVGEVTCNSHAGVICEAPCRTAGFTSCCSDESCFVSSEDCLCNSDMCPVLGNCCPDILFVGSCPEPPVCSDTDVRLVGVDDNRGIVEICLLGRWGTVCTELWDDIDAAVVCRQLGLESQGALAYVTLGLGDGTTFLDQVICSGNESRLFDCRHRGVGVHSTSCTPGADAEVLCPVCTEGAVQLRDGATESSGRVEVCFAGLWGTVCDDFWDDRDAAVVCRQLGYNDSEATAQASERQTFPPGTGFIFLDNVDCTGDENNILLECAHIGTSDCSHSQDAGAVCVPEFSGIGFEQPVYIFSEATTDNDICITTNSTPLTGSVEITVQSEDISASVNSDYSRVLQRLTFTPGITTKCVRIEIQGTDMQCEIEESILIRIDIITGQKHAGLFLQNATVIITDAVPFDTLYNFGSSAGDLQLFLQPNGQAPPLTLTQTFPFFGRNYSTIYVNPNGILSFESPLSGEPSPFPLADIAAIAPFWEVVEYSGSDRIYFQESSQWCLLETAYALVALTFPSVWNFFATRIFTATWIVSEPMVQNSGQNTFQAVLATDGDMSFVALLYDAIEWGDRDGIIAGINAGDGTTFEAPNAPSGSLLMDSNIGIRGVYGYRVDQFDILQPYECYNGDLSVTELGLLEMCVNNTWTRICAESLGEREAAVACQQLGYSVGEEAAVVFSGVNEISNVLMNDVNCSGGESRLLDCLSPPIPSFAEGSCDYSIVNCTDIVVGLVQEEYTVSENDSVNVCAVLNQTTSRRVVVRVATVESASQTNVSNQAKAGSDYNTTAFEFVFEAQMADQLLCVDVPIIDDNVFEGNEVFLIFLSTPTPVFGVQLDPQYAFITISDNDAPPAVPPAVPSAVPPAVIFGIVAGVLSGLLLLVLVVVVVTCYRYKKQKKFVPDQPEMEANAGISPYAIQQHRMMSVASAHIAELSQEMLIPSTIIRLLDSIGEGEFGLVYKGEIVYPMSTETVAVKTLKGFFDQNHINDMLNESLKMWKLNHPNVMTLIGVCIDGGPAPFIVMPFMANGSLLSHLKKERLNLVLPPHSDSDLVLATSKKLMDFCIQAAKGMEYLASQKFVHKDLAARNCMLDFHFVIKIADFGLSENIYDKNYIRHGKNEGFKLPIKWMAIESLTDLFFSEKTDVWAYGVTVWEVFSGGKIPYPAVDPVSLPSVIQSGYRAERPNNAACTDAMYSSMLDCWKEDPKGRPTFSQLVSSLSSQLEGMAGYLDVGMLGDWQTSDGDVKESPVAEETEHNDD